MLIRNPEKWVQRDQDNVLTVPWIAVDILDQNVNQISQAISQLEKEIECINFPYVKNVTSWSMGLVFVAGDGCFTSKEQNIFQAEWQMISLDDGCNGYSTRVIHQMVISSLGLIFEHQRSDSNIYIDYDGETVNDDSPFKFDISSVMLISQRQEHQVPI